MTEIRRPKRGETEDDLLNQQRQYFQETQPQNGGPVVHGHEEQQVEDKMKNLELTDEEPPSREVLQEIKERDTRGTAAQPPRLAEKRHFPEAQTRAVAPDDLDAGDGDSPKIKKPSIFARNMQRRKTENQHGSPSSRPTHVPLEGPTFVSSVLVDGSGVGSSSVAAEIHRENTAILSSMTPEQLAAERAALVKSLDPGTIEFIKSRRQQRLKVEPPGILPQSPVREPATDTDKKSELSLWPHMGQVEERKLKWMDPVDKDTERVVTKPIGLPARFNFEGKLVDRAEDVPPSSGLYHHGEEPEAAGYTLDELLHISRSLNVPQRVLALQTLAKVLSLCHQGFYDECLDRPLVPLLLEAGLVHILRWALDDSTQVGIAAAVEALAALLVSTADEVFLDMTFSWHLGERSPCLGPGPMAKNNQEVTDMELVKADVIEGLLRMHLLPRLRYILEVVRPPATVVLLVLDVLIRVARHSPWSSGQIVQCPRLLPTISHQFLPLVSSGAEANEGPIADVYGVPLAPALKLFRVIAAVSKELCRKAQDYVQVSHFMKYLSDAPQLSLESLRTWTVFIANGLSTESITECIPVLFRQLQFFNEVSVCSAQPAGRFDCDFGSSLFQFLLIGLNATPAQHVHQMSWIKTPATLFVKDWMNKLRVGDRNVTHFELSIVGRACVLAAASVCDSTYCDKVDDARSLFETCILPFLRSPSWDQILSGLRAHSSINCTVKSGVHRYSPSLPSLGSVLWSGHPSPVLLEQSTVHFVTHILQALHLLVKRDPKIVSQLRPVITGHPAVLNFLQDSTVAMSRGATLVDHWFTRHETHLMHLVVELAALDGGNLDDSTIYHRVCLTLPCRLQCGDEAVALRLLELSFHQLFLSDWRDIDRVKLKSTRHAYVACFLALMEDSKSQRQQWDSETSVTFTGEGRAFFPLDFVYSPIWLSYLDCNNPENQRIEVFDRVVRALEWVTFLFRRRPTAVSSIPPESHICKVASAFMVCNDAFLLQPAQEALRDVLNEMSSAGVFQRVNFEAANHVDGIASFHDFFLRLLEHFEAVSYGDRLFGSLLLTLVRQRHNKELRKLLWTEHVHCLRLLRVPFSELMVPVKDFLVPLEDDERLLIAYFGCLVSGSLRTTFCPVLYLAAVHHLHHFLFGCEDREDTARHVNLKRSMVLELRRGNEEWHGHLLCYNGPDQKEELGFQVVAQPSVQVQDAIAKLSV